MDEEDDRLTSGLLPNDEEFRPKNRSHLPPPDMYYAYTYSNPLPPPNMYYTHTYPNRLDNIPPPPPPDLPPLLTTPTRSLLLSLVPYHVNESTIRRDLEVFGEIRAIEMERVRDGLVTLHFYNLREAYKAWLWIKKEHMQQQQGVGEHFLSQSYIYPRAPPPRLPPAPGLVDGHVVWAQFTFPVPDGDNQGILVVFNMSSDVTARTLKKAFEAFGGVKWVSDHPSEKNTKFVEYYDIRHASEALINLNGKEINGNIITVQYSRPEDNSFRNAPPPPANSIANKQLEQSDGFSSSKQAGKGARDENDHLGFLIKEDEDLDSRTTLMIKKIPKSYSEKQLLKILDAHCFHCNKNITSDQPPSSYDLIQLPVNLTRNGNVGYAFVNMTSPQAAMRLRNAFHNMKWDVVNVEKICQVSYAKLQGLDAFKEHFKNSTLPWLPLVFDPPRDGLRYTPGITIVERRRH